MWVSERKHFCLKFCRYRIIKTNILIIGSGIGGCVLARGLAASDCEVTILESGARAHALPYQDECSYVAQDSNLLFTRGSGFGGSTNFWHNGLLRLSPKDFLPKNDQLEWKLPFLDIEQHYEEAETLLTNFRTPILIGEQLDSEMKGFANTKKLFGRNTIRYLVSPINAKVYVENDKNIKTQFDCKEIKLALDGNKIVGVEYYQHGIQVRLACDILVLACGGIGTPALLLGAQNKNSFQNENIGKFLQDHISSTPLRIRFKSTKDIKSFYEKVPGGFTRRGITFYDPASELNHIAYPRLALTFREASHSQELRKKLIAVRHSFLNYRDWFELLKNLDLLIEAASHKFNLSFPTNILNFNMVSEQKNLAKRRVEVIDGRLKIYWDVNLEERESIRTFCAKLVESFSDQVQRVVLSAADSIPFTACAHHSGTMRISDSPNTGVVDSNLKMFDFENVYVCDGSVLPRTGYANTGLTIASLAIRLSKHIGSPSYPLRL